MKYFGAMWTRMWRVYCTFSLAYDLSLVISLWLSWRKVVIHRALAYKVWRIYRRTYKVLWASHAKKTRLITWITKCANTHCTANYKTVWTCVLNIYYTHLSLPSIIPSCRVACIGRRQPSVLVVYCHPSDMVVQIAVMKSSSASWHIRAMFVHEVSYLATI